MDKKKIRNMMRLISAIFFGWLYIPHAILSWNNHMVRSDINVLNTYIILKIPRPFQLFYHLHTNRYFRTLFYYRIGPIRSLLISWYRPGDRYFSISTTTRIGEAMCIIHPYSTIINAESIGDNFSCIHLTTVGNKFDSNENRPIIGNNVTLGANVTIIGKVHIGDNVTIGAGSVVVKDVPSNCVVAGNPAKVIRQV